jgi:hypothetical protein
MSKYASFEDSIRLKKMGLPQPDPQPGQTWWNEFGYPSLILSIQGDEAETLMVSGKKWNARINQFFRFYYAPPIQTVQLTISIRI